MITCLHVRTTSLADPLPYLLTSADFPGTHQKQAVATNKLSHTQRSFLINTSNREANISSSNRKSHGDPIQALQITEKVAHTQCRRPVQNAVQINRSTDQPKQSHCLWLSVQITHFTISSAIMQVSSTMDHVDNGLMQALVGSELLSSLLLALLSFSCRHSFIDVVQLAMSLAGDASHVR